MVVLCSKEEIFPDVMKGMNTLRRERSLYDVRIIVGGHDVTAHKCVLASVSDYFKSLLIGPFKTDASVVEVDLTSVALDVESTEAVIEYLYTGTINIDEENLEAILKLASFLLIEQLQELCVRFMERSTDLTSYLRYFQLSVDYIVPDAEEVASRVVKSRFHDWLVFNDATKKLMPCHLRKLFEDYDIFETCTMVETFSFIVDWVTSGKSDDHMKLGLKILKAQFEEYSCSEEDRLSDEEIHSDQEAGCNNETKIKQDPKDKHDVTNDQDHSTNLSPQIGENCSTRSSNTDEAKRSQSQTSNEIDEIQGEPQIIEEMPCTIEVDPINDDEQSSDVDPPPMRKRMGLIVPQTVEIIMGKLESLNDLSEFTDKCKELIDRKFGSMISASRDEAFAPTLNSSEPNQDLLESDVEQVLIAVAPKKCLKDFLAKRGYERDIPRERDEAIFDLCVYVPRTQSWFYLGEGTNDGMFKEIAKRDSHWPINFCMKDKLCFVSLDQKCLYMYSLNRNKDGVSSDSWSSVSYKSLVEQFSELGPDFNGRRDVRLCCSDKGRVYLIIKINTFCEWTMDFKVKFRCYRLSKDNTWKFMFHTRIDEERDIYESRSLDIHVSSGKKDMLIAVQGLSKLHVLRVNPRREGFQRNILDDEAGEGEDSEINWMPQTHFWIMRNGNKLSFVDELVETNTLCYRNVVVNDEEEDMSIDQIDTCYLRPRRSSGCRLKTNSTLFKSVCAGSTAWLYSSDGKFQTSLYEIRLSEHSGLLEFNRHVPPPFQSVTILAAGVVKKDILANLRPLHEFLQE